MKRHNELWFPGHMVVKQFALRLYKYVPVFNYFKPVNSTSALAIL